MKTGQTIRKARETKQLSQTYVAGRCGISQSTLSDIERGKIKPLPRHLSAIGEVLDIDLGDVTVDEAADRAQAAVQETGVSLALVVRRLIERAADQAEDKTAAALAQMADTE